MILCALMEVVPVEGAIAAPLAAPGSEGFALPRGALVQADDTCWDGSVGYTLVSVPRWTADAVVVPLPGARGCVSADLLRPPEGLFLVQTDALPLRAGALVAVDGSCDAWRIEGAPLDPVALSTLRPMSASMLADAGFVQDAYEARFGPLNLADIPLSGDGFVGLPLPVALDDAALARLFEEEHLDTLERQQKADRWFGGETVHQPTYAHFLGTDALWSDVWATPDTIVHILEMASAWAKACPSLARHPDACLLQLGDLAWYEDVLPDPLGHKDHHTGRCADVRLFRTDASRYEAYWNKADDRPHATGGYDRALTTAFLRWLVAEQPVTTVLFGDPVARRAVPFVQYRKDHNDHIHVCF